MLSLYLVLVLVMLLLQLLLVWVIVVFFMEVKAKVGMEDVEDAGQRRRDVLMESEVGSVT